jgi:hypothetical protein
VKAARSVSKSIDAASKMHWPFASLRMTKHLFRDQAARANFEKSCHPEKRCHPEKGAFCPTKDLWTRWRRPTVSLVAHAPNV